MPKSTTLNVYVVCEGEATSIADAPAWLNQDNWMCDWIFVGAFSASEAVAVAEKVDAFANTRKGRAYTKVLSIQAIRSKITGRENMNPQEIYSTQGNNIDSERLQFNQTWFAK